MSGIPRSRSILFALLAVFQVIMTSKTLRGVAAQQQSTAHILLYTATADFRHDSIPTAIQALHNQSTSNGGSFNVRFDATEDRAQFTDGNLEGYDAVMFVSTTGEVLDASGKTALRGYLNKGGNFIAVHSASDTLRNDSWFGDEVGAFFDYHPPLQNASVDVLDASHPSTNMLPAEWHVQDEMYNFKSDPRSVGAVVILSANESSYVGRSSIPNFAFDCIADETVSIGRTPQMTVNAILLKGPLIQQERGAGVEEGGLAGRSFYTSLGHLNETWMDDLFIAHVMGGVMWALESNTTKAFNSSGLVGNVGNDTASSPGSSTASSSGPSSTSGGISSLGTISMAVLLVAVVAGATMSMA